MNFDKIIYNSEYVYNCELNSEKLKKICKNKFNIVAFDDFLYNDRLKNSYIAQALNLFDNYEVNDNMNKQKRIELNSDNIFTLIASNSNLGDIHTILTANFKNFDILVSDDKDLKMFKDIYSKNFYDTDLEIINSATLIDRGKNSGVLNIDKQIIKNIIRIFNK